jgi:18S rRNA (guanine1575-N7)-methyltransferase
MLNMANERIERKRGAAMGHDGDDDDDDEDDSNSDSHNDMNDDDDEDSSNEGGDDNKRKKKKRWKEEPSQGDLLHHDMGTGLPFRPASFDACISISALQWLCYSNTKEQIPKKRLTRFFSSLYQVLRRGARAVLQFYPETSEHAILISECAAKVGFAGGIVVDYPNSTKAKKHYLVLSFERSYKAPQGLSGVPEGALLNDARGGSGGVRVADKDPRKAIGRKAARPPKKKKGGGKTKEWILHKKETQRKKGKDTRKDTKYTGRKRPMRF